MRWLTVFWLLTVVGCGLGVPNSGATTTCSCMQTWRGAPLQCEDYVKVEKKRCDGLKPQCVGAGTMYMSELTTQGFDPAAACPGQDKVGGCDHSAPGAEPARTYVTWYYSPNYDAAKSQGACVAGSPISP